MATIGVRSGKNPTKEYWPLQLHVPKAYTADANGATVDRYRNGGYNALTLMLLPGLWTDGTHAFIIEESDDNFSTSNTVAATDVICDANADATNGTFTTITAATSTVQRIDYIGRKRYVRARYDYTAGTTGAVFSVVALLFSPSILPAA